MWNTIWKSESLRMVTYCSQLCILIVIEFFVNCSHLPWILMSPPALSGSSIMLPKDRPCTSNLINSPSNTRTRRLLFLSDLSSSHSPIHSKQLKWMETDIKLNTYKKSCWSHSPNYYSVFWLQLHVKPHFFKQYEHKCTCNAQVYVPLQHY